MDKNNKPKKAWYKRAWMWIGLILLFGIAMGSAIPQSTPVTPTAATAPVVAPKEPAPVKWDVDAIYATITNGMTKSQVEAATGKTSDSCTETTTEYTGKIEICSYGNGIIDRGTIMVTYTQDAVSSKTKTKY